MLPFPTAAVDADVQALINTIVGALDDRRRPSLAPCSATVITQSDAASRVPFPAIQDGRAAVTVAHPAPLVSLLEADKLPSVVAAGASWTGLPIKKFFPIRCSNATNNFGSFGLAPLAVDAARLLYQTHVIDSDVDIFYRVSLFESMKRVRQELAEFLNHRSDGAADELFLCDNAGDGFNIIAQSFIFSPHFLSQRRRIAAQRTKAAAAASSSSSVTLDCVNQKRIRVMLMSCTYPMVKECCAFHVNRHNGVLDAMGLLVDAATESSAGGIYRYEVVTCPITPAMVADEAILIEELVRFATEHVVSAVVLEHVTFAPSFVMPINAIAQRIKAVMPECYVCIDAAHAIGMIPVNFRASAADGASTAPDIATETGAAAVTCAPCPNAAVATSVIDSWFSNCQKWLLAPRSTAVLYVPAKHHDFLHPSTISNFYRGVSAQEAVEAPPSAFIGAAHVRGEDKDLTSKLHAEMLWRGTRDASAFLCLRDVLWWRARLGNVNIMNALRDIAFKGAHIVAKIWGTAVLLEDRARLGGMMTVKLPVQDDALVARAGKLALERYEAFVAMLKFDGVWYARIGGQIYLADDDYTTGAQRFLDAIALARSE